MSDFETRDELESSVALEAEQNVVLDQLASKDGDITLEDLRQIPGASDLSDEDLNRMWEEASADPNSDESQEAQEAAAEQVAAATGGEAVQTSRGWKVYDASGNEVADFSKMSVNDFLKSSFGYQANGKEHRKSLDDVFRVASYGHFNENKLARVQAERDQFYKEASTLRPQLDQLVGNQRLVSYALQQFVIGNDKPLTQLIDAVKQNFGAPPRNEAPAAPATTNDAQLEAAGQRFWYEEVVPAADRVAADYGAKQDEVRNAIATLIQREPAETLTRDKIASIVNEEIPMLLEQSGYRRGVKAPAAAAVTPSSEVAELKRELAELKTRMSNADTDTVRAKNKNLPPGRGGVAGGASPNADPMNIPADAKKSKDDYRKFLRS